MRALDALKVVARDQDRLGSSPLRVDFAEMRSCNLSLKT